MGCYETFPFGQEEEVPKPKMGLKKFKDTTVVAGLWLSGIMYFKLVLNHGKVQNLSENGRTLKPTFCIVYNWSISLSPGNTG